MSLLRTCQHTDERGPFQYLLALELGHTANNPYNKILSMNFVPLNFSQAGIYFLDCFVPDTAGVQDDYIRLGCINGRLHSAVAEAAGDLFRIQVVHLAAEGFN